MTRSAAEVSSLKSRLLWQWRRGFKTTSKTFFDLAHGAQGDYSGYLPDAAFEPLALTNGVTARAVLSDKLLFEKVVGQYAPVPRMLALIERGAVIAPTADAPVRSLEALLEWVQTQAVALKPARGAKGKGVYSLRWEDGFLLDDSLVERSKVAALVSNLDYYLVVPWIEQAGYAAAVFPEAGNSLRLITMRDPGEADRPFIHAAVQKFGTRVSAPTDNWSRGALFAPVDVETGILKAGLEDLTRTGGKPVWRELHPDTGAPIAGLAVPRWSELTAALLELLGALPIFTYVGWDVMVTEGGFAIIEGNSAPVVVSLQLTRPALADARVRRFIAHHKIRTPGLNLG